MSFPSHRSRESETETAETASNWICSQQEEPWVMLFTAHQSEFWNGTIHPKGFVRHCHSCSCQRPLSICPEKESQPVSSRNLPNIFSLHRSGPSLNPADWSTTAAARCFTAHPACRGRGCCLRVPFSSEYERRVSSCVSQVSHEEGMSWNCNLHSTHAIFK